MKGEIITVLVCMTLVLGGTFLFFQKNLQEGRITGLVVDSQNSSETNNSETNESISVGKKTALEAINNSKDIMNEMQENNFSVNYVNDTLTNAKKVLKQAEYAEVLRNPNSTSEEKMRAREALELVDWKEINYSDVLEYTKKIEQRKENAFLIKDKITVEENKLERGKEEGFVSNETIQILEEAKENFYEGRYNETRNALSKFRDRFEEEKSEVSTINSLAEASKSFVGKYWHYISVIFVFLMGLAYFIFRLLRKRKIKHRINKLKEEEKAINDLIKKLQEKRYKKGNISEFTYNTRMKKYKSKLDKIERELPVLENKINKKKRKKNRNNKENKKTNSDKKNNS